MTRITRQRMPLTKDDTDAGERAIDEAAEIRARLDKGFANLQKRAKERDKFGAIVTRMIGPGGLVHLYNDALDRVQELVPVDRLAAMRDELAVRLERGFHMENDADGKVEAQFARLLTRHDTICDALRDSVTTDVLGRIGFWEDKTSGHS